MLSALSTGSVKGATPMSSRMTPRQFRDQLHRRSGISSLKAVDDMARHIEGVVGQRYHDIPREMDKITRKIQDNKGNHISDNDISRFSKTFSH